MNNSFFLYVCRNAIYLFIAIQLCGDTNYITQFLLEPLDKAIKWFNSFVKISAVIGNFLLFMKIYIFYSLKSSQK